jgi:tetratricopeptide (TPR) repeat protein
MITPALKKFLSVLSLATIATTAIANPVFAEPTTYQGNKGTYTIDIEAGNYRGCLDNGGCISLGRKNLIKSTNTEFSGTSWKNGEYTYSIDEGELKVAQNGRIIFQDSLSTRSSEVRQVNRSKPVKNNKVKRNTECRTLSECNQAIESNPQSSEAYLNRANFFESKYNVKDAASDYDKAVELNSDNSDVYLKRAKFKSNNWHSFGDASILEDYDKAIEVDPQNSDVYLRRGKDIYSKQLHSSEKELADYNQAIELNSKNSSAYLSRAEFKQKKNDVQGALVDCKRSLQYASTATDISLAKQCISRIDNR